MRARLKAWLWFRHEARRLAAHRANNAWAAGQQVPRRVRRILRAGARRELQPPS